MPIKSLFEPEVISSRSLRARAKANGKELPYEKFPQVHPPFTETFRLRDDDNRVPSVCTEGDPKNEKAAYRRLDTCLCIVSCR